MTVFQKIVSLLLVALFTVALMGCEKEGPAEKAGKSVDNAVEKAADKVDDAAEEVKKEVN